MYSGEIRGGFPEEENLELKSKECVGRNQAGTGRRSSIFTRKKKKKRSKQIHGNINSRPPGSGRLGHGIFFAFNFSVFSKLYPQIVGLSRAKKNE